MTSLGLYPSFAATRRQAPGRPLTFGMSFDSPHLDVDASNKRLLEAFISKLPVRSDPSQPKVSPEAKVRLVIDSINEMLDAPTVRALSDVKKNEFWEGVGEIILARLTQSEVAQVEDKLRKSEHRDYLSGRFGRNTSGTARTNRQLGLFF